MMPTGRYLISVGGNVIAMPYRHCLDHTGILMQLEFVVFGAAFAA